MSGKAVALRICSSLLIKETPEGEPVSVYIPDAYFAVEEKSKKGF